MSEPKAMTSLPFATIPEVVGRAEEALAPEIWDYARGGSDSETTLRRNRSAFDWLALLPRVLRDVAERSLSTTFLGQELRTPVVLAPIGSLVHFDPAGALACGRAAERTGTASFVSTVSSPKLETVRAGCAAPLYFQLYVKGDRQWTRDVVQRVQLSGYQGICLTVDSAVYGRRERDLENRFSPRDSTGRPNLADRSGGTDRYQASLSWRDLDALRDETDIPLIVKGILAPEDAELAIRHGASAVYVSNHGGRQLDHAPSTVEVLAEIVDAVAGRAEVIVDSGFMRGTDVVKALALGADVVAIGKVMIWGLAAGGEDGLVRVLDLLNAEIDTTMALLGVTTLSDLNRDHLRNTHPLAT